MKKTKKHLTLLISLLYLGSFTGCNLSNNNNSSSNESSLSSSISSSESSSSHTSRNYTGEGRPSDDFGKDGDTYLDTTTQDQYVKSNGRWILIGNDGKKEFNGVGSPSNDLGKDGDTYTDTSNGNVYEKQHGQWVLVKEGEKEEKHLVEFDLNGGHMPDGSITLPSQEVKNGGWVSKPSYDPIKDNSTFQGWYAFGEGTKWQFTNSVYGDLVLVAKYTTNESEKVTLTINPNNGDESYSIETFVGDIPKIETPAKEGFNFVGWYYEDDGTKFNGIIGENDNGRTIVAKFEKSKFNFTYQLENDNTVTITGLLDINTVNAVIPSSIDGYVVASIGEKAFQNRINLVSVTLASTIKNIHPKAFTGARMLSSVSVDSSSSYFTDVNGVLYTKDMKEIKLCPPKNCNNFIVPGTVEKIGDYAFYGHKDGGVSTINFNEGLVEIGERAFYENTAITTLNFPSTLRKIGNGAFNCVSAVGCIQQVRFNDGLEVIGDSAFVGAYFKDKFSLPSSVKQIGSYAFANCTAITGFKFPKSLEVLGDNAFAGATGILEITIEEGNTNFVVRDNLLYTSDMKKVVMCPSGHTKEVNIVEGVTEIGDYAFYMVDQAQVYNFPSTLTKIGKQAFAHCYGLRSFEIPDSVTQIGENCFDLCESLKTVTFGSGLKEIPKQAFIECYSLTDLDIPSTIETIGKEAFFGCASVDELDLKEGLKRIDNAAFCFSTTEYNSNATAGLKSLTLPNSLTYLGERAFANQSSLTTVSIGSGLEYFGATAFDGAPVSTLTISSNNQYFSVVGKILYNKNQTELIKALTSNEGTVTIPEGVKVIKEFAFDGCKAVTGISLPNSLEEIEEGAFYQTRITDIEFKSGLKRIGDGAFSMGYLKTVKFAEGLEYIGQSAFNANDIESLALPNSLKHIGETAFSGSWKLNSLTFGNGLTYLGDRAFYNCKKIVGDIILPGTIEYLGQGLFVNNTSITNITFTSNENYVSENGLVMNKDKTEVYAYAPAYNSTSLTLPNTVKEIKDYGLCDAQKLTSLTLPSSLLKIGTCGLANVAKVAHLVIPSSVTYIGAEAFTNWGYSINQKVSFQCSEEYALMHFDVYFLNSTKSRLTVEYNYKG